MLFRVTRENPSSVPDPNVVILEIDPSILEKEGAIVTDGNAAAN
jgi:O-acetyl-ADP-ribose deacetylase (regulator of RNase III)